MENSPEGVVTVPVMEIDSEAGSREITSPRGKLPPSALTVKSYSCELSREVE